MACFAQENLNFPIPYEIHKLKKRKLSSSVLAFDILKIKMEKVRRTDLSNTDKVKILVS